MLGTGGGPATGGAPGTGGAPAGSRAQACDELAIASAAKNHECSPFGQALRFGSQEAQAARIRLNCSLYDLPGVRFPPNPFKPCAEALAAQPCTDWVNGVILPACRTPGAFPVGASCSAGDQCSTDLCDVQPMGCGKCATLPAAGQPCFRGFCAIGAECNPAGTCVTPGLAGAACDANNPCLPAHGCHGGKCSPLGQPGAPCASNDECDFFHGVVCGAMNTKCVPATTGPMCMIRTDGTFVFCAGSATCRMDGTCVPPAADGATCSTGKDGPTCLAPAQCLSDLKCHLFMGNRLCAGMAARPVGPGPGLLPPEGPGERLLALAGGAAARVGGKRESNLRVWPVRELCGQAG
jgi:hypothetical protein